MVIEIKCEEVWREISNYIDGDINPELRERMQAHFKGCARCTAVLDGARNVVQLAGDGRIFDLPNGFGKRLYAKLSAHLGASETEKPALLRQVPLGITQDAVTLGSHLIYFWQTREEFERGVSFLALGLQAEEHCVLFGHHEANQNVLEILRAKGHDVESALRQRRLHILRRDASAPITLARIEAALQAAVRSGATVIRYLGNLALVREPLPAGEEDVIELETSVTSLAQHYPCVVVCMYDVNTLSGRLVVNGGFRTHPLAVCGHSLRPNPYYLPKESSPASLRHVQ